MDYRDNGHACGQPYSPSDLATCARWLGYSGCAQAQPAVERAVKNGLDMFGVLVAWETRLFGHERMLRTDQIHDLDEFDGIVEELEMISSRRGSLT
ncbi:MAG: hypothetical protein GIW99_11145 [Candidatus Eremiobacteraeota bacterium]|nr:hypothetical protein [Candidatus Eremiobacteraeota bacterium]MBC5828216.1 hypothetical protein [Candidatus Eremiobacteraeota bacterium]